MKATQRHRKSCKRLIAEVAELLGRVAVNHLALWPKPAAVTGMIPGRPMAGWRMEQAGASGSAGERGTVGDSYHRPIMGEEVVHFLQPESGKLILDGTLGGAGHTEMFLKNGASVWATDRDPAAIARARELLEPTYGERFTAIHSNFADFPTVLEAAGLNLKMDGMFFDLGLSSRQLENPARGFSFMRTGRLDMRFDPDAPLSAEEIVNKWPEEELVRIIRLYGEDPAAKRIARAIVRRRESKAILLTTELAEVIAAVIPQRGRTHPATKTFQAIRLEVNQELQSLERALEAAPKWLAPGGRLVILTFHSLEDRIVKHFLRDRSQPEWDKPEWPAPRPNPNYQFNLVVRKAIEATEAEIKSNPRARSCKLRVAERISSGPSTQA